MVAFYGKAEDTELISNPGPTLKKPQFTSGLNVATRSNRLYVDCVFSPPIWFH